MKPVTRPMLASSVVSLAAGVVMIPFILVHLMGDVMGEGDSLRTPFDQLITDLSLDGSASFLLMTWLALPLAWFGIALGFFFAREARSRPAMTLNFGSAALGVLSVGAYGLGTGFLFFAPAALASWTLMISE